MPARRCWASRSVGVLITALGWRIGIRYSFHWVVPCGVTVVTPFRTKKAPGLDEAG